MQNAFQRAMDGFSQQLADLEEALTLLKLELNQKNNNVVSVAAEIRQLNALKRQLLKDIAGMA